jgi:hypothetical protein
MLNTRVADLPDTDSATVCNATSCPSTAVEAYGSFTPSSAFVLIFEMGHLRTNQATDYQTA